MSRTKANEREAANANQTSSSTPRVFTNPTDDCTGQCAGPKSDVRENVWTPPCGSEGRRSSLGGREGRRSSLGSVPSGHTTIA